MKEKKIDLVPKATHSRYFFREYCYRHARWVDVFVW